MGTRTKGPRHRTRHKLRKSVRGMPPVNQMLKQFKPGDRVQIIIEPSVHKGMPHPRFHGKAGVVVEKKGRAYVVGIKDVKKQKLITCHPIHLRKVK